MTDEREGKKQTSHAAADDAFVVRRIVLQFCAAVMLLLLVALFWYASSLLLLIFSAVLVAILLSAVTNLLVRWVRLPRGVALVIVLLLAVVVLGVGIWQLAPGVAQQSTQLMASLTSAVDSARAWLFQTLPQPLVEKLPDIGGDGTPGLQVLLDRAGTVFVGVFGAVANVVIILFLSIYLAAQPQMYVEGIVTLFPKRRRARMCEVLNQIGDTLGKWLLGKLLTMLIVGVITSVGLLLLDVPLALVLGLVAGLLEFIPYLGPILAGVPAVLIGFSQSPTTALYVFLLFAALQIAESYLLQPLIAFKTVSLPPAVTITVQVLFAIPFGLLGIALATPLAAMLAVLISMLYVQDVLEDDVKPPGIQ